MIKLDSDSDELLEEIETVESTNKLIEARFSLYILYFLSSLLPITLISIFFLKSFIDKITLQYTETEIVNVKTFFILSLFLLFFCLERQ